MVPLRVVIPRVGGPEVLRVEPFEPTPPGPGEVAVEVYAAGVNFADLFCRLGLYAAAPPRPFVPGFELAGEVVATGPGVAAPRAGERVIGVTRFGGCATRLNLPAAWTRSLPDGWSFAEGAAFPVAFLTAWYGLVHQGRIARGETAVIHSAAGGVGSAACQLARHAGARTIGTVGSEGKRAAALAAGADEVVVSPRYAVWPEIDRLTAGRGVDLVLDAVGGRGLAEGFRRLRPMGRLVVYGFADLMPQGGLRNWPALAWRRWRTPRFDPLEMTGTNRAVIGFNLVYLFDRAEPLAAGFDALLERARAGALRPVVGARLPFERAADAHRLLQSRASTGKVVLVREPGPRATIAP